MAVEPLPCSRHEVVWSALRLTSTKRNSSRRLRGAAPDASACFRSSALQVSSLMPPPFPFKLFVISAGVFRFNLIRFTIAIFAGRAFRFLLEGYLAVRYGAQAREVLAREYPWIALGLAILIVGFFVTRNFLKRRSEPTEESLKPGN